MTYSDVAEFLREHPRLLGVLFGASVLLTQVGAAAAGASSSIPGP